MGWEEESEDSFLEMEEDSSRPDGGNIELESKVTGAIAEQEKEAKVSWGSPGVHAPR